jgi:hypothetical protein
MPFLVFSGSVLEYVSNVPLPPPFSLSHPLHLGKDIPVFFSSESHDQKSMCMQTNEFVIGNSGEIEPVRHSKYGFICSNTKFVF